MIGQFSVPTVQKRFTNFMSKVCPADKQEPVNDVDKFELDLAEGIRQETENIVRLKALKSNSVSAAVSPTFRVLCKIVKPTIQERSVIPG